MPKFRNVSPYGALDFPLLGRVVEAGEVFELTREQARHIKGQDDNFEPVKETARSAPRKPAKKAAREPAPEPPPETDLSGIADEGAS